jgi:hypothetical protein
MPLADLTAISNLALDYLGEPYLTAYATDTTVAAQACRLHLPQCIETVLEGHVWSFATRCSQLTAAAVESTTAQINVYPGGENNGILLLAQTPGPSGNEISLTIETAVIGTEVAVDVTGSAIVVTPFQTANFLTTAFAGTNNDLTFSQVDPDVIPTIEFAMGNSGSNAVTVTGSAILVYLRQNFGAFYLTASQVKALIEASTAAMALVSVSYPTGNDGTGVVCSPADTNIAFGPTALSGGGVQTTAADVIDAITADTAAALLVTAVNAQGHDGTGVVAPVEATFLEGGSSTSTVYAPAYGSGFNLPSDCLRVLKIDTADIDIPRNDFEIQGRYLLLAEESAEAPVIHYITSDPPVDEWPTTFTDAVAFLLASRLAPKLAQDQALAADMLQKHEMALGKARSKDTRETRSKENFGPRQLAARSGLVRARYGNILPPY